MIIAESPGRYEEKENLIKKTVAFDPVERIPVAYNGPAFSPVYNGVSVAQFVSSKKVMTEVLWKTMAKLEKFGGVDVLNIIPVGVDFKYVLSSQWLSKIEMPGRELSDHSLWQVKEQELLTVKDYDEIIEQGWPKFRNKFFKDKLGFSKFFELKHMAAATFSAMQNKKISRKAGYPTLCGTALINPFESLCGGRSMNKFFIDLYRMPDKIQAAMDEMLPHMIKEALNIGKLTSPLGAWIPGWRTASSMLNSQIWDRFVLPYFIQLTDACIDADVIPVFHLDQDWGRDLEKFKQFPAKKCIASFDGMTDIRKAKKVLDGHMAVMGDIPATLFATGTPDDIYEYVRELVRDVGPTGFILCPGCDAPINTKPENMEAFIAASHEYGVASSKC